MTSVPGGPAGPIPTITAHEFDEDRLRRDGRWVIAFVADWCGFCREFRPRFEARVASAPGSFAFGDVTDQQSPLWEEFDLDVVPTLVAFQDGRVVSRLDGILGEGVDDAALTAFLAGLRGGAATGPR